MLRIAKVGGKEMRCGEVIRKAGLGRGCSTSHLNPMRDPLGDV